MRIVYYLITAIMSFCFTVGYAQSDSGPVLTQEHLAQNASAASNQIIEPLAATNPEEDEFKEQLKEQRKIDIENTLIRSRLERELADLRAEIERLRWQKEARALKWELEEEEQNKNHEKELLALNREKEKLLAIVALSQAKMSRLIEDFNLKTAELQNRSALLKVESEKIRAEIEQTKAKKERNKHADGEPIYLQDPLQAEGTLVVSDRAIDLNGVVTPWQANYVTDQIRYFNNKDKNKPIFIVIDASPGGSVLAGARILKAMENSKAPVYVVVKSFAASMAALIATLAKKSYAYPNAIILHHQPWTFMLGNVRETKEQLAFLQEWWKRLGGRVAKKMGISLDKLDKQLYDQSARGDWTEFADHAKKIKWVDHIIAGIEDSANRELPDPANYTFEKYLAKYYGNIQKPGKAEQGTTYLPILGPKDFYYLYNPANQYQLLPIQ